MGSCVSFDSASKRAARVRATVEQRNCDARCKLLDFEQLLALERNRGRTVNHTQVPCKVSQLFCRTRF